MRGWCASASRRQGMTLLASHKPSLRNQLGSERSRQERKNLLVEGSSNAPVSSIGTNFDAARRIAKRGE